MVFVEYAPKLQVFYGCLVQLGDYLFLLVFYDDFANKIDEFEVLHLGHLAVDHALEESEFVVFFEREVLEFYEQQIFQGFVLLPVLVKINAVLKFEFRVDGGEFVPILINLFDHILEAIDLLVLLLHNALFKQLPLVVAQRRPRRTSLIVAFMSVDLHIAVDVHSEEVLIFALEVVTQVVCIAQYDICGGPLVYVLKLKFDGVAFVFHHSGYH